MHCLIADDHALIREGLKQLLSSTFPDLLVHEACNGNEVNAIAAEYPDLNFILLDYYLPETNTLALISELANNRPDTPVIIFSGIENPVLMRKSLDYGASGFIPKSSENDQVIHAIRLVLSGGVYTPASMLENIDESQSAMAEADLQMDPSLGLRPGRRVRPSLTTRQLEVLKLISLGRSNKEIADELELSSNTVKVHITAILQILHTSNRIEAVTVATELGLV